MNGKNYMSSSIGGCKITGGILGKYQKILKERAIPYQWEVLNDRVEGAEKSGAVENFKIAAESLKKHTMGHAFRTAIWGNGWRQLLIR